MRPAARLPPFSQASAMFSRTSEGLRLLLNPLAKAGTVRRPACVNSMTSTLGGEGTLAPSGLREFSALVQGSAAFGSKLEQVDSKITPRLFPVIRMQVNSYIRDPYSRREAYGIPSDADIAETIASLDRDPEKMLKKGDPDSYTVRIRDVMPVGYFVDMPNGREGYLPASDFGFSGGLFVLRKMYQVGDEITVRITERGGGGREILSMKKLDPNAPPKPKIIGARPTGPTMDTGRRYGGRNRGGYS